MEGAGCLIAWADVIEPGVLFRDTVSKTPLALCETHRALTEGMACGNPGGACMVLRASEWAEDGNAETFPVSPGETCYCLSLWPLDVRT